MNKEKQRIAIAKACGHSFEKTNICSYCHGNTPYEAGDDYGITLYEECKYCNNTGKVKSYYVGLEDYVGDLNVMHEAEKLFTNPHSDRRVRQTYRNWLHKLNRGQVWSASATQRAEAFLRTLNLWEE